MSDPMAMAQRQMMLQMMRKNNQEEYKPDPCGGTISAPDVTRKIISTHGIQGKKAVLLACKFCDKDSVVADRKCLWCGENNSWILNEHKELACPTCNKKFTGATCKLCKKKSPALRLYLLFSPEFIAEEQARIKAKRDKQIADLPKQLIGFIRYVFVMLTLLALIYGVFYYGTH